MASANDDSRKTGLLRLQSPVKIDISAHFLMVNNVDTVQQLFDASVVLRGKTTGLASLAGTGTEVTPDNWDPRIRILNLIETRTWKRKAEVTDSGEIELKWTIDGVFAETFELQQFPRDRQDLSLIISSNVPKYLFGAAAPKSDFERNAILDKLDVLTELENKISKAQLMGLEESDSVKAERQWLRELIDTGVLKELQALRPSSETKSSVIISNFCMSSIFDLSPRVRVLESQTKAGDSTHGTVRPVLIVSLSIVRHASYFMWNIELPMGLLTLMAGGTFFCERNVADRLGLSLTLVLTAVAFKFVIAADLPKICYLTKLDKYVLFNFFGIAVVVVENSLCETALLAEEGMDHLGLYVWVVLMFVYFIYHLLTSYWQKRSVAQQQQRFEALSSGEVIKKIKGASTSDSQTAALLSPQT
jgi:hypothetical protein